jgi:RimJ/RimL family protein N-acetyltransferase
MTPFTFTPWTADDTLEIIKWFEKSPEMVQQVGCKDVGEAIEWITRIMQSSNSKLFGARNGGEELIGYVAATNAQADGSCHAHIGVSPDHRGKGTGVMRDGLAFAFEELGMKMLIAAVPLDRPDVEKFDKHFGFVEPDAKILLLTRGAWEQRKNG